LYIIVYWYKNKNFNQPTSIPESFTACNKLYESNTPLLYLIMTQKYQLVCLRAECQHVSELGVNMYQS